MNKIKLIYRNLTMRWMLVSFLIILPINILTVAVTNIVTDSYEEKITESYQNQLDLYIQSIETEFTYMKNEVMNLLTRDNLAILTTEGTSDPVVELTRINLEIAGFGSFITLSGFSYLWDHNRNIINFYQKNKIYAADQIRQIKNAYLENEIQEGIHTAEQFLRIAGASFLTKQYHFQRISFGILYDVESMLSNLYHNSRGIKDRVYLADEEGNLLSCFSEQGFTEAAGGNAENLGDAVVLKGTIGFNQYQLIHWIEPGRITAFLPELVRIIRILAGIGFAALPFLYMITKLLVLGPLWKLRNGMRELETGNFDYRLTEKTGSFQMDFMYSEFNHMADQIHTLIIESYESEIEKLQIDSINMQLIVNQHMLLNFLNTIYSLSQLGKQEQVSEFTLLMMKYFRYVLRQNVDLVSVKEEMEFISDYLRIQRIRFPSAFTYVYSIAEEAKEILIPQLLIENFVENAVKHGLVIGTEIEIIINIRMEEEMLLISICDTGNGMEEELVKKLNLGEMIENRTGKHIGIWNCRRRLKLYYQDACSLTVTSRKREGTQIFISLPAMRPLHMDAAVKLYRSERMDKVDNLNRR